MPAGRPRTVSLPPEQMIQLGEEMISWILENDPLHLSEWYCITKGYTEKEWDTMHVAPEFFPYYEKALKLVGLKYLKKDSNIEPSLKQRWQRVYFSDVRKREDEDLQLKLDKELEQKRKLIEFQSKLDTDKSKNIDPNVLEHFKATMSQLSSLQSERKIVESNINNDVKS